MSYLTRTTCNQRRTKFKPTQQKWTSRKTKRFLFNNFCVLGMCSARRESLSRTVLDWNDGAQDHRRNANENLSGLGRGRHRLLPAYSGYRDRWWCASVLRPAPCVKCSSIQDERGSKPHTLPKSMGGPWCDASDPFPRRDPSAPSPALWPPYRWRTPPSCSSSSSRECASPCRSRVATAPVSPSWTPDSCTGSILGRLARCTKDEFRRTVPEQQSHWSCRSPCG